MCERSAARIADPDVDIQGPVIAAVRNLKYYVPSDFVTY